jgi:trehalose-phosphatase
MHADLRAAIASLDPNQPLLVALDFDGTLSHLVPVPSAARPAPGVLHWLEHLERAALTDVVLISGRALHDLAEVSGAADIALLIGSHGQEHGTAVSLGPDEAALLADLRRAITEDTAGIEGVWIEGKPAGFAVHVRHCTEPDAAEVVRRTRGLASRHPDVHVIEGKMVVELSVRPLDKGTALRALIEAHPERRVIFAGDDVTDEAAMAVLKSDDIAIKVGDGDTLARHRIADPTEMVEVLEAIAGVRRV